LIGLEVAGCIDALRVIVFEVGCLVVAAGDGFVGLIVEDVIFVGLVVEGVVFVVSFVLLLVLFTFKLANNPLVFVLVDGEGAL
jgi:hypothetical protein